MYLPLNNAPTRKLYYQIRVVQLCFVTVSLPLFAFIICVLLTMYKDFDKANNTHCKVPNIFPSISASIGNYEPQITIWKAAVYIHAPLRFFIVYLRWQNYRKIVREDLGVIVNIATALNVVENICLLGLTHWTSLLYYPYHEVCFKTFIGTSIFYMLFISMLLTKYRRRPNVTSTEHKSVKFKWRLCFINIGSFAFAAYFFLRHNRLCEPYVYSMFAFSEYVVVVTNILFHLTTVYDLPRQYVVITKTAISLE